ncbi:uncharacterized protein LOC125178222 [Hyalella azteca]|uniref:Uncharacterized protein LOC125178222 n=1 Tax=Hyalella azteca TaxID=294128 RepID=A0A979FKA4_HYAAZ|nr:uncharacterized protein LOC125178222 [Hyalella azteca]
MELRMCKRMVEFKNEMSALGPARKMEFNHNGSRLVRIINNEVEVVDPRTQRVVQSLSNGTNFQFTEVDHELILKSWRTDAHHSELQLRDLRFPSSHAGRIRFPDQAMLQYVYSQKDRSILSNMLVSHGSGHYQFEEKRKLVLHNKSRRG